MFINDSQAANGKIGVALALPADSTFPAGSEELLRVTFNVGLATNNTSTIVGFEDQPIVRQLVDTAGNILPAVYLNGEVTIAAVEFEADVSPRPSGNKAVTVADWVLIGRFAAGLDSPTNASEFQRADCAPRSSLGNGHITVTDWVQAGRYVAGLDPLTPAGGPTGSQIVKTHRILGANAGSGDVSSRQIKAGDTTLTAGQTGTVTVSLQGHGDENALGFSLTFDPSLSYAGASLGNGGSGATLNVNASQISSGRLGFVLALSSGKTFAAGANELVKVSLRAPAAAVGSYIIGFSDEPVLSETSDSAASELASDYVSGTIIIDPLPSLRITQDLQNVTLVWPLSATNYVLQQADNASASAEGWTGVTVDSRTNGTDKAVSLPIEGAAKFYRLYRP
jgi:hypothetical protein